MSRSDSRARARAGHFASRRTKTTARHCDNKRRCSSMFAADAAPLPPHIDDDSGHIRVATRAKRALRRRHRDLCTRARALSPVAPLATVAADRRAASRVSPLSPPPPPMAPPSRTTTMATMCKKGDRLPVYTRSTRSLRSVKSSPTSASNARESSTRTTLNDAYSANTIVKSRAASTRTIISFHSRGRDLSPDRFPSAASSGGGGGGGGGDGGGGVTDRGGSSSSSLSAFGRSLWFALLVVLLVLAVFVLLFTRASPNERWLCGEFDVARRRRR